MSLSITKKPLLPVITITKDDTTTYTFNPHTGVFDFRLRRLQFSPPYDHVGGSFTMSIVGADGTTSATNTLLNNIDEGNEITISLGKTDATSTLVFRGIIERTEIPEPVKDYMDIVFAGPDWGSHILKSKLLNRYWSQKKQSDGETLDETDNTVLISQIISDMVTSAISTPTTEYSAEDMGVVYDSANIMVPSIRMPQFEANFEYIDDKLTELDNIAGVTHYIDANKNLIVKDPTIASSSSGILLTDDYTNATALGWDQSKLGLIMPGSTYVRSLENHKRRIYGLGGDQVAIDQKKETDTTSTTIYDKYIAMRFTPQYRTCRSISLLLSKTGSPSLGPTVELIEDFNGEPTGTILRDTLRKDKDAVAGTAGWINFDIGEILNTSKNYWVVLSKVGDVSNTYNWHRDALDTGTHSTSTDNITWTPAVTTNRWNFAYRAYYSVPVLTVFSDFASATSKHFVEHVIRKPDITDLRTMTKLITNEAGRLFKRKEIFKCSVFAPDTLLQTGQTVLIQKNTSGYAVNASFTVSNVEYIFESDEIGSTGTMHYVIEAFRYTVY